MKSFSVRTRHHSLADTLNKCPIFQQPAIELYKQTNGNKQTVIFRRQEAWLLWITTTVELLSVLYSTTICDLDLSGYYVQKYPIFVIKFSGGFISTGGQNPCCPNVLLTLLITLQQCCTTAPPVIITSLKC